MSNKDKNNSLNPDKAIALFYDGEHAPTVTAKGSGDLAEEIIRIAREHEVPLYENHELAELLATLELGDEIPEILYLAIAQIIAFVYHLQGKVPTNYKKPDSDCKDMVLDKHAFINQQPDD